ncbi:MAG: ion channel [Desulfuromonadales bacterium]
MKLYLPGIKTFILGRYGSLLLVLSSLLVLQPFVDTRVGKVVIEVLFIAALVAGLRAVESRTHLFRFDVLLLIVSVICGTAGKLLDNESLFTIGLIGESLFLFLVGIKILIDLFRARKVTGDSLAGAVCVYLLIGLIWAYLYLIIEVFFPGSFSFTQGDARLAMWVSNEFYPFYYFSLVTVTTVGYGDLLPVSTPARTLATMEGILGQVYLTILVARLVGMYLMNQQEEQE